MKHPYYESTLEDALKIGRDLVHGPMPEPTAPTPSVPEALEAVKEARRRAGFNWITGRVAEELLRAANGEPYPFTT